ANPERQHAPWVEAEIDFGGAPEALEQETRAHQEHERQRELHRHEESPEAGLGPHPHRAERSGAQHLDAAAPRRPDRRPHATDDAVTMVTTAAMSRTRQSTASSSMRGS